MKFKDIKKKLIKDGWFIVEQKGSHVQFKHPVKRGRVTLPFHGNKEITIETLKSISKQSGIELP